MDDKNIILILNVLRSLKLTNENNIPIGNSLDLINKLIEYYHKNGGMDPSIDKLLSGWKY